MSYRSAGELRRLIAPRSVALVGVSDRSNMSLCVHGNLVRHGFPGEIHLINPNQAVVHGCPTLPSLSDIGRPVDLVFALVGAARVPGLMEEAAGQGVGNLVVLSGGFAEESESGVRLQQAVVETARRHSQQVLGPNTIGFLNLHARTVLYGSPLTPPAYPDCPVQAGSIGVVVQSGIMVHAMLRGLLGRRAGVSIAAAVGNEAVIQVHHLIDHLVDDARTNVIALFIETIRDREGFRSACLRAAAAGKPVVALKAGRSAAGAATAISHTGALAGDDRINRAAFRQLGIITVESLEELVITSAHLAQHGPGRGLRAAFVALSGGFCEIFADRAEEVGLRLPPPSASSLQRLRDVLPPPASISNPLDTTGIAQSDPSIIPRAIEVLAEDPAYDVVFVGRNPWRAEPLDAEPVLRRFERWTQAMANAAATVLTVSDTLCDITDFEWRFCRTLGLPAEIGGITHGLRAFAHGAIWRQRLPAVLSAAAQRRGTAGAVRRREPMPRRLSEYQVLELLGDAGVPVVPWRLARTADEAVSAAAELGYPVAIKISSPEIAHKSAIGAVALDVADAEAVAAAWQRVMRAARGLPDRPAVDGVLVMPMRKQGIELIVGVKHDSNWGLALVLGLGGVWTEMLADTAVMPLPVTEAEVREMLLSLRGARLLRGGHGIRAVDPDAVVRVVMRLAELSCELGDRLESIELNPVKVNGERIEALDGLIVWRDCRG